LLQSKKLYELLFA